MWSPISQVSRVRRPLLKRTEVGISLSPSIRFKGEGAPWAEPQQSGGYVRSCLYERGFPMDADARIRAR